MKVIFANAAWFLVVCLGLVGATIQRHMSLDWGEMGDVRMKYDFLYGSLALMLAICSYALFKKKSWGYSISVAANGTLTIVPLAIFAASLYLLFPDLSVIELLKMHSPNLIMGFISLYFWVFLAKSKEKLVV